MADLTTQHIFNPETPKPGDFVRRFWASGDVAVCIKVRPAPGNPSESCMPTYKLGVTYETDKNLADELVRLGKADIVPDPSVKVEVLGVDTGEEGGDDESGDGDDESGDGDDDEDAAAVDPAADALGDDSKTKAAPAEGVATDRAIRAPKPRKKGQKPSGTEVKE